MIIRAKRGFTLIEIVVVLVIISILAAATAPLAFQAIYARREQATREELETIKKAIIGENKKTAHGEEFTFGFVGDVGGVPDTLDRLKTIGTLPAFSFDTTKDTGAGWNGPYIMEQFGGGFKEDAYDTPYIYSTDGYTNTDLGVEVFAKISSLGPDGMESTTDDLSIEILKPEILSRIIGMLKYAGGSPAPNVSVTINYPDNGNLTTAMISTNSAGIYEFSDIPIGDRTITVTPKLLYIPGTAVTTNPQQYDIRFTIANYSSSNISIDSITLVYSGGATYEKMWIDGEEKSFGGAGSGYTVTFSSRTLTGSTGILNPFPIRIQSPVSQPPDIIIDRMEPGELLTFEVRFMNAANMSGVSFSATFSDTSEATFIVNGG